jgi:hypothetical protein
VEGWVPLLQKPSRSWSSLEVQALPLELLEEGDPTLQARTCRFEELQDRGIIVPTQGDLGTLADAGTSDLSIAPSYRPGCLSAREAAV